MAFLTALTNYGQKESRRVVYLFLIYYGLTYVVGDLSGGGPDAGRSALMLKNNAALPFSEFFNMIGGIYATETSMDIAEPLIMFIISRFTDHFRILFAVYAAIFGYFYLKSINLLYTHYQENPGWNGLIHLAFFIAIIPISAINGFRMWTAAWIFFYGAYHVILYRNTRYIPVALAASLVHWSFLSANLILLIYYFAGNRNIIYFPVAVASFVFPNLLDSVFKTLSNRLGGGLQGRFEMYSDEAYVIVRQEADNQNAWFLKIGNIMVLYYILLAMMVIHFKRGKLKEDKAERNLYSFLLLFLAFVNFGKNIPSFGGRFQLIFFLFGTLYVFLYMVKMAGDRITLLTITGLFPMLLFASIVFRQGSDSINAWIFTPGLGLPLLAPAISISEFLFK
jgi:hypothetical protein